MKIDTDLQKKAFSARLNEAAKAAGMHYYGMYSDVGAHFGMSPAGARRWFVGEVIPFEKIEDLAKYYRVRSEWLRNGSGPMREVQGIDPQGNLKQVEIHNVPVVRPDQWLDFGGGNIKAEDLPQVLATGKLSSHCFAIQIEDNSLADRVLKGMYVVVDAAMQPTGDDLGVAFVNGSFVGGMLVKRDTYMIVPPNTDYRPIDLGANPQILGVMVSIVQQPLTRPS